jgi:hypothetical protein
MRYSLFFAFIVAASAAAIPVSLRKLVAIVEIPLIILGTKRDVSERGLIEIDATIGTALIDIEIAKRGVEEKPHAVKSIGGEETDLELKEGQAGIDTKRDTGDVLDLSDGLDLDLGILELIINEDGLELDVNL